MMGQTEQNRLDLQHQMLLIMLDGRLYLAPIKPDLQDVLDVGTGTGKAYLYTGLFGMLTDLI
jgi:hypothetical protein